MCLSSREDFRPCKTGYKVFCKKGRGLYGDYQGRLYKRPKRRWLHERDFRLPNSMDNITVWENVTRHHCGYTRLMLKYPVGWHVFHSLAGAKRWKCTRRTRRDNMLVIYKVEVREPHTTGMQENQRVTVCSQIKILEEVK